MGKKRPLGEAQEDPSQDGQGDRCVQHSSVQNISHIVTYLLKLFL